MPRQMALTGITAQTMQMQNANTRQPLHKVDDKNKTLDEKKEIHKRI